MPNQTPISRYVLAAIAALMLYSAVPVADDMIRNLVRSRNARIIRAADLTELAPLPPLPPMPRIVIR